ncbi:uncharacterized protein CIMG_11385 [Coccidioides immitis RS]|uniref:Uncharacterized protein n=2 Tax=Coccidioides immitis TaxID=5501 RepID=A0A0D8JVR3_COCIM|nr:uncharacterized protein CIMG_11385 [Coccidioides immitis RS]KJF61031.1 hypothetical protein CIMG_11385 [Coccidioides immitis RS]KMU78095.1 hypothetical protein CISG_06937 [Coccidioides immitis RMSCC 3703]
MKKGLGAADPLSSRYVTTEYSVRRTEYTFGLFPCMYGTPGSSNITPYFSVLRPPTESQLLANYGVYGGPIFFLSFSFFFFFGNHPLIRVNFLHNYSLCLTSGFGTMNGPETPVPCMLHGNHRTVRCLPAFSVHTFSVHTYTHVPPP